MLNWINVNSNHNAFPRGSLAEWPFPGSTSSPLLLGRFWPERAVAPTSWSESRSSAEMFRVAAERCCYYWSASLAEVPAAMVATSKLMPLSHQGRNVT